MPGSLRTDFRDTTLARLAQLEIPAPFGVVCGSHAVGRADAWSDIDLIVVSPVFDHGVPREAVNRLWRIAARTDSRIEPIACGSKQWIEDVFSPILEVARREGAAAKAAPNGRVARSLVAWEFSGTSPGGASVRMHT